jgi:hypothetical protein
MPQDNYDAFAQRLLQIRRHLHGLELALDALERDMLQQAAERPNGERATEQAREVIYRQGPSEVKFFHE